MIRGRTKMRPVASLFKTRPGSSKIIMRCAVMKVFGIIGASVTVR